MPHIESQTLYLQQPAISILMYPCTRSVPSPTTVEVLIAETVVVPARSEMELQATAAGPLVGSSHTSTWLIKNLSTSKTKAIVARSLVSLQQSNLQHSFVTRVINPTPEDVTLSRIPRLPQCNTSQLIGLRNHPHQREVSGSMSYCGIWSSELMA